MVDLEPSGSGAALGAAVAVSGEHGRASPLPARGRPDAHSWFARRTTSPRTLPLTPAAGASPPLGGRVYLGPHFGQSR